MRIIKLESKLLIGVLATIVALAPLACSSDSDSVADTAEGGEGGDTSDATAGKGSGSAGKAMGEAGATEVAVAGEGGMAAGGAGGGVTPVGGGGAAEGGTPSAGGNEETGGRDAVGGNEETGDPFAEYVDAACDTEASLDCDSELSTSEEKANCADGFAFYLDAFPNCAKEITALAECLSKTTASDFTCLRGAAAPNDGLCATENGAVGMCQSQ